VELDTTTPIYERIEMARSIIERQKKTIDGLVLQCKKMGGAQTLEQADKIQKKINLLIDRAHAMTAAADIIKASKKLILGARIECDSPSLASEKDRREYSKRLLTALEVTTKL